MRQAIPVNGLSRWLYNNKNIYSVVIYGAGIYGKLTYNLLKEYKNINIAGWVDKNYQKIEEDEYPMKISSPELIKELNIDYVIVAVVTRKFVTEICNRIIILCGKKQKIVLIDENEFNNIEKINLFEDKSLKMYKKNWDDYIYLRNKYEHFVELKKEREYGKDSGITWLLWFQGWENAPSLIKKCKNSVEKFVGNRKIIYLDEESYNNYIDIPEDIKEMYRKGIIAKANYSDIIRLCLLEKYGGLWLDATILLTGKLEEYITSGSLFVFQFPKDSDARTISSWLMYSHNNNIIIQETLKLLYIYWRTEKRMLNYFAMHFLFRIVSNIYYEEWSKIPYFPKSNCNILERELNNPYNKERIKQILEISKVHKLSHKLDINMENSVYEYILREL